VKKKSVLYIFQLEYPWDIRVEKITNSICKTNNVVHILNRNVGNLPSYEKIHSKLYYHRFPNFKNIKTRNLFNFPAFFSPVWFYRIISLICRYKIDLIIVRDLPLAPIGYFCGKILRKKVILDMAEDYPALIKSTWDLRGPKLIDYFIRNPYLLKKLEKFILPLFEKIIVVSELSKKRISSFTSKEKIYVIGNVPLINHKLDFNTKFYKKNSIIGNVIRLIYVGFVEAHRGLDTVIKAVSLLMKDGKKIEFNIIGTGTYLKILENMAFKFNVQENIKFLGWIDHLAVYDYIEKSDIGIIPHYVTNHTNTTIPNKIFDYMIKKKPVIATQSEALKNIILECNCGIIYNDKSEENLKDVINKMFNSELRMKLGNNGYKAILEKYNWEIEEKKLFKLL